MRYRQKLPGAFALVCLFNAGLAVAQETDSAGTVATDSAAAVETDSTGALEADFAAVNWSGFYGGIGLGSRTLEIDWTTTETRDPAGGEVPYISDAEASLESSETEPGLYIGYNWNPAPGVVLGIEAVSQFFEHEASIEDRIPGLSHPEADPNSFVLINAESGDSFDLRLRGGLLLRPELLLYATAGTTQLEIEITSVCPGDVDVCNPIVGTPIFATAAANVSATILGVGAEYALERMRIRLEYLTADYGDYSFTALPENLVLNFGADATVSVESSTLQLGVSLGL